MDALTPPVNNDRVETTKERWGRSTNTLREITGWPEAQANAWLLDQARGKWASVVWVRTSMASLVFTMPGESAPLHRTVNVSWSSEVYEFTFVEMERMRKWVEPLVTADRCFAPNAPAVLDSFLYQLAGAKAPA